MADLDAELVRGLWALPLADAFALRGHAGCRSWGRAAALLLAHPPAKAEQVSEAGLEPMVAVDLCEAMSPRVDAPQIGSLSV